MTPIIQNPDKYNFAGNIRHILLPGDAPVTFGLSALLTETYPPYVSGTIRIPLRAFFEILLSAPAVSEVPGEGLPLRAFEYSIDGQPSGTFYVIPGGVAAVTVDTELWIKTNFLTWQQQTRRVT